MTVLLDHLIVHARDCAATAAFLTELLDLPEPKRLGHFTTVRVGPTSLDFVQTDADIAMRHFAFRVDDAAFDGVLGRIRERGLTYWADPFGRRPGEINRWDDGRGLYFKDPNGHLLEILTRPYGSGGLEAAHPNPLLGQTREA